MYILLSDLFEKEINTYLKLEIRVVCREFLAFRYFFRDKSDDYLYQKS